MSRACFINGFGECETALMADPANATAKDCLDLAALMKIDEDLNKADNLILIGKPSDASAISANWITLWSSRPFG